VLLLGAAMLTGRTIGLGLRIPGSRRAAGRASARRMLLLGAGYAAASLACTFGVLLAVIAQAQAAASYAGLLPPH
jgi:cytochrome c biogenesis protein CcdA